jgi:hypothetical protein
LRDKEVQSGRKHASASKHPVHSLLLLLVGLPKNDSTSTYVEETATGSWGLEPHRALFMLLDLALTQISHLILLALFK